MQQFDLIVIGGGPAGYVAGERAGAAGMSAAVFEERSLGGVCLNEGCIPSKALLNSAKLYYYAQHSGQYGVKTEGARLDHKTVITRKDRVVSKLVAGVQAKLKHSKVTVISARATIAGRDEAGFIVEARGERYGAAKVLLAAGSKPIVPPIPGVREGIESGFVVTSREMLDVSEIPERLVVIGGGVIGLEMASYFSTAGAKVTIVEMLDRIGGALDTEVAASLLKNYEKQGIDFKLGCKVTGVEENGVRYEAADGERVVEADKVLLCIGRRACVDDLGLDTVGALTDNGAVVTDEYMRTNVSGLYAAGDVNGKYMLAHTAYREAEVAVNHMLGRRDVMRYNAIPSVIYTNPEVASVGETEESAQQKGYAAKTVKLPMAYSGRYLAEVEGGNGFCKLVVDTEHNRLLGAHIMGSYASEMIFGAGLMIETEMKIDDIKEVVFPHPTVCEIIRETLFEV